MDEIAPQIALLRQMYMGLDKKSRKAFLASIGHKDSGNFQAICPLG